MGWLKDLWDTFILPSEIDTDQEDCVECGFPFTFDEWELKHTTYSGETHADCCNGCEDNDWTIN